MYLYWLEFELAIHRCELGRGFRFVEEPKQVLFCQGGLAGTIRKYGVRKGPFGLLINSKSRYVCTLQHTTNTLILTH